MAKLSIGEKLLAAEAKLKRTQRIYFKDVDSGKPGSVQMYRRKTRYDDACDEYGVQFVKLAEHPTKQELKILNSLDLELAEFVEADVKWATPKQRAAVRTLVAKAKTIQEIAKP